MCKFIVSALIVVVAFAAATAEEYRTIVTKFEDGKITFSNISGTATPKPITLSVAADAKFLKGKYNKDEKKIEADGNLDGGKDAFAKLVKEWADKIKGGPAFIRGVPALVITDGTGEKAKVTEIRVIVAKKK